MKVETYELISKLGIDLRVGAAKSFPEPMRTEELEKIFREMMDKSRIGTKFFEYPFQVAQLFETSRTHELMKEIFNESFSCANKIDFHYALLSARISPCPDRAVMMEKIFQTALDKKEFYYACESAKEFLSDITKLEKVFNATLGEENFESAIATVVYFPKSLQEGFFITTLQPSIIQILFQVSLAKFPL